MAQQLQTATPRRPLATSTTPLRRRPRPGARPTRVAPPPTDVHAAVAVAMGRIQAGDMRALDELADLALPRLRAVAAHHLRDVGVAPTPERIEDCAWDLFHELIRLAGAWRPDGGALPWVWAAKRLRVVVIRNVGQFTDELDEHTDLPAPEATTSGVALDRSALERLHACAGRDRRVALLLEALELVAAPRDREVWLRCREEEGVGNVRPSVTVAAELGMRSDAVRKAKQRVGDRLADLAGTDPRFAELVPFLGPRSGYVVAA